MNIYDSLIFKLRFRDINVFAEVPPPFETCVLPPPCAATRTCYHLYTSGQSGNTVKKCEGNDAKSFWTAAIILGASAVMRSTIRALVCKTGEFLW